MPNSSYSRRTQRQHLRQIFRDQAGAGFARRLAMHPRPDAGRLERRHALRQHSRNHPRQHVAGTRGREPGWRIGGNGCTPVRRRHHRIRPLQQHDGAGALAAARTRSSFERSGCLLLIS